MTFQPLKICALRHAVKGQLPRVSLAHLAATAHAGCCHFRNWKRVAIFAMRPGGMTSGRACTAPHIFASSDESDVRRIHAPSGIAQVVQLWNVASQALRYRFNQPRIHDSMNRSFNISDARLRVAAGVQRPGPQPASSSAVHADFRKDSPDILARQARNRENGGHFAVSSICASMMRRTSSAMEMPRRLAFLSKNALCGLVNEIICLTKGVNLHLNRADLRVELVNQFPFTFDALLKLRTLFCIRQAFLDVRLLWSPEVGASVVRTEDRAWSNSRPTFMPHECLSALPAWQKDRSLTSCRFEQFSLVSPQRIGMVSSRTCQQELHRHALRFWNVCPQPSRLRHVLMIPEGIASCWLQP